MLFAILFALMRFFEIVTLITTMGMLAYFVNGYNSNNLLTPTYILLLFIVSVLALVWAIFTLFRYHQSASDSRFVSLVDMGFVGALIAGVYYLRFIATADCAHIDPGSSLDVTLGIFGTSHISGFDIRADKSCGMLKTCFAFGIMNCIFFATTAFMAWSHAGNIRVVEEQRVVEERRVHRGSSRRHHSYSGSRHESRRSSHSHHRSTYV